MAKVTIKRMFGFDVRTADLGAMSVTFTAHDSKGKPITNKVMRGKMGTPHEASNYEFDVGGLQAKTISAVVNEHFGDTYTLEWTA